MSAADKFGEWLYVHVINPGVQCVLLPLFILGVICLITYLPYKLIKGELPFGGGQRSGNCRCVGVGR